MYGAIAGLTIPLGGLRSRQDWIRSAWVASELRHSINEMAGSNKAPRRVILYLMFQEIAPKVVLKNAWFPPMGALFGFFVGVLGSVLIA